jgi:SAM-dependent methyltransferase
MSIPEPTAADRGISATLRDIEPVDRLLRRIKELDAGPTSTLLDLGCGTGYLTVRNGEIVGADTLIGVDMDPERLATAAGRGVKTIMADLGGGQVALDDASADVATSFGVLAYLPLYDTLVGEAARLVRDGGWFLLSMPNLGSYTNRFALLFGYQPREVEISGIHPAGIVSFQRRNAALPELGAHLHAATLRCMRELLGFNGFDVVEVLPLSPSIDRGAVRVADRFFGRFPSWSRRFAMLARRRPR